MIATDESLRPPGRVGELNVITLSTKENNTSAILRRLRSKMMDPKDPLHACNHCDLVVLAGDSLSAAPLEAIVGMHRVNESSLTVPLKCPLPAVWVAAHVQGARSTGSAIFL